MDVIQPDDLETMILPVESGIHIPEYAPVDNAVEQPDILGVYYIVVISSVRLQLYEQRTNERAK